MDGDFNDINASPVVLTISNLLIICVFAVVIAFDSDIISLEPTHTRPSIYNYNLDCHSIDEHGQHSAISAQLVVYRLGFVQSE
jgi:hypothetical protein